MTTTDARQLLEIDEEAFPRCFSKRAFAVRHELAHDPLLTLEAMAELADRLPLKSIERHRADLPLLSPGQPAELEGPPSQTVRELETGNSWMVMWYIEQVPEYRGLVDKCLDQVERYVGGRHGGMHYRKAYLFLSAPGATTPAHFDPEENLLLQIKGRKHFTVGALPPEERQAELDRYFDGGYRNLDRMPQGDETFDMDPGDGVYVPQFMPHWVKVGGEASISLSITFRTRAGLQMERASHFNARLRRLHLSPRPAGRSPSRDRLKASVVERLSALRGHRGDAEHGDPAAG